MLKHRLRGYTSILINISAMNGSSHNNSDKILLELLTNVNFLFGCFVFDLIFLQNNPIDVNFTPIPPVHFMIGRI